MARLISEDDVMRMLTSVDLKNGTIADAKSELRNVKTAYDVDAVVAELEDAKSVKNFGSRNSGNLLIPLEDAIDIVRKGGVE